MAGRSSPSVYISYRREDVGLMADLLRRRLVARFGGDRVHVDADFIERGVDFHTAIESGVAGSSAVIVLIGPEWASAAEGTGRRRLDYPRDGVASEIRTAFRLGIPVIPVLVGGARMTAPDQLPPDLRSLADLNAACLRDGSLLESDLESLVEAIHRASGPSTPPSAPPRAWPTGASRTAFISYPVSYTHLTLPTTPYV